MNCLREWRGDLHWALVTAAGLDGVEASILHNAWLGYERDWLAKSRGSAPGEIACGWQALEARGLVSDGEVNGEGIALRRHIEDETDRLGTMPWELLGEAAAVQFAIDFEPPCELLLRRVDETAGPNYQPAFAAAVVGNRPGPRTRAGRGGDVKGRPHRVDVLGERVR